MPLLTVLRAFGSRPCRDRKDRVYGLISLIEDLPSILHEQPRPGTRKLEIIGILMPFNRTRWQSGSANLAVSVRRGEVQRHLYVASDVVMVMVWLHKTLAKELAFDAAAVGGGAAVEREDRAS